MKKSLLQSFVALAMMATSTAAFAQQGYKYDSDCNLFKNCAYTLDTWLAEYGTWNTSSNSMTSTQDGSTYTVTIPDATDAQWKAQYRFKTDIELNSSTTYQFSVRLKSNVDLASVVLKEDIGVLYDQTISLTANEEKVVVYDNLPGKDASNIHILFDFGGNPDNTVVTVSDIVLRDAGCDDEAVVENTLTIGETEFNKTSSTTFVFKGQLEQGEAYTFGGSNASVVTADDFYYNPDYFKKNDDGSFTFKALTGNYFLRANVSKKYFHIYPLTADGNAATYDNGGAMYANGGSGFGKPSFAVNPNAWGSAFGWNPNLDISVSMAQVEEKIYTLTLTVGKQLRSGTSGNESFKFYGAGEGWGGELSVGAYEIVEGQGDEMFRINAEGGDLGNIFQIEALTDGDTYVVTLDRTGDMPRMSVKKAEDETGLVTAIRDTKSTQTTDAAYYTLSGMRVAGQPQQAGLYIHEGKKIVVK